MWGCLRAVLMVATTAATLVEKLGAMSVGDWAALMAVRKAARSDAHLVGYWVGRKVDTTAVDLALPSVAYWAGY